MFIMFFAFRALIKYIPESHIVIPILVPFKGAMDSMSIMSDASWTEFHYQLSEKMVKPTSKLNLGYKFTTNPQKKPPNRLSNPLQLLEMIEAVREALARVSVAKAKGKAPSKVFKVEIVDLDARKDKDTAKAAGKSKKKVSCSYYIHKTTRC